jgi:hypothetical protein
MAEPNRLSHFLLYPLPTSEGKVMYQVKLNDTQRYSAALALTVIGLISAGAVIEAQELARELRSRPDAMASLSLTAAQLFGDPDVDVNADSTITEALDDAIFNDRNSWPDSEQGFDDYVSANSGEVDEPAPFSPWSYADLLRDAGRGNPVARTQ